MARSMILHSEGTLGRSCQHRCIYKKSLNYQGLNKISNVSDFRVFGSPVVALNKTKNEKCSAKGKEYVFVGYSNTAKAYRLFDVEERKFVDKRDEIFCEKTFISKTTNEVLARTVAQNSVPTENKQDEGNLRLISADGATDEEYQSSPESGFMGFESDNEAE